MKKFFNYVFWFVITVMCVSALCALVYLFIPGVKTSVDELIHGKTYSLIVETDENVSIEVSKDRQVIKPGPNALRAGGIYKVVVTVENDGYKSESFYLNGRPYQSGTEFVCDRDFKIESIVVGVYDLTINYINCEDTLKVFDITNAPNELPDGVAYVGFKINPGQKVLYSGQMLYFMVEGGLADKEFASATINGVTFADEDELLGYRHTVNGSVTITVEYVDIIQHTSAEYFAFNDGVLTGFSAEGQALYDAGELTELILPASYSIGEVVTEEVTFTDIVKLDVYLQAYGYNFTFINSSGSVITVTSQDSYNDHSYSIFNYINKNGSITITTQVTKYLDGNDICVTSIGNEAFSYLEFLTSVTMPDSIVRIGNSCFCSCLALSTINFSNSLQSIGNNAFCGCSALTSLKLPSSIVEMGVYAFSGCQNLMSLEIPSSISLIYASHFEHCIALESIVVAEDHPKYASYDSNVIVDKDTNTLVLGCKTSVIPDFVTSIGNYAFDRCQLTSIEIPNSVTNIGSQAFLDCSLLTSIEIPNSVTNIERWAFNRCNALFLVDFSASTQIVTIDSSFSNVAENCKIVVPDALYNDWINDENWTEYASIIVKSSEYVA